MKRAVNQWCFPRGTALDDVFQLCSDALLDGVELNLGGHQDVGLTLATTEREAQAIRRKANQFNLELKSLSTGLLWESPLSAGDKETRERARSIVRRQLEIASALEMDTILVVPGVVTKTVSYEDCYRNTQNAISELAVAAQSLGVKIGIENVWNKFLLSPLEMRRFVDELDSPWVGVYFDVGNCLQFGYPEQWIQCLDKRILKVHVKDFSTTVGNLGGFVPLLAGHVDWPLVIQALRNIGYDDYLTAEIAPYGTFPYQAVRDAAVQLTLLVENSQSSG